MVYALESEIHSQHVTVLSRIDEDRVCWNGGEHGILGELRSFTV
jgi:hypothetical protein